MDELAVFRLEGAADSDAEIQASIRRGHDRLPTTRLVKISTPYMKSGVCRRLQARLRQNDPDLLCWRASTVLMIPASRPNGSTVSAGWTRRARA